MKEYEDEFISMEHILRAAMDMIKQRNNLLVIKQKLSKKLSQK